MAAEMDFLVHYMCPYAQRALYAYSFKNIQSSITEMSLVNKSEYHLSVNPLGKVPALRVTKEGKTFNLYESLVICDYFDSFPGPSLYPQNPDGTTNQEEKALVKIAIATYIDPIPPLFYKFYREKCTPENVGDLQKKLLEYNDKLMQGGSFFMTSILGRDELTMADVVLLPHIERIYSYKEESFAPLVEGIDLSNLWAWYNRMGTFEWVQRMKAGDARLNNIKNKIDAGGFPGLDLPVTLYD